MNVAIYPNPVSNGLLNVNLNQDFSEATVRIIDVEGRVVYVTKFESAN
jgi:hypothetical protein